MIGEDEALWQAWNFDPEFVIPVLIAGWFYTNGLRRWTTRTREHRWWRTASCYTGLLVLLRGIESPIDRLGEHHFSMHLIQHELVVMLAVPLILLGAPTTPSLLGMPRTLRLGVIRPLAKRPEVRRAYRTVTHPAVAVAVITAVFWFWHLAPGWYDRALDDDLVHGVQHFSFMMAALLLWWTVIDPEPLQSRISYMPRVLFVFAAGVPKHFLGAIIVFAEEPLFDTYTTASPLISLAPLEDQPRWPDHVGARA